MYICIVDRYGIHAFIFFLSTSIVFGQTLFSFGVMSKSYTVMHIGRFFFGLGGESLSVAQSRITTRWFQGKELAMAIGVNLAFGRLGSVLNDIVSPWLAYGVNVPFAVWFGTVTCIASFGCCYALVRLDKRYQERSSSDDELYLDDQAFSPISKLGGSPHFNQLTRGKSDLPLSFWLICSVMCLYYGADIPFNAIHSGFLESKWYKGNPKMASQIMAVPDTISALLIPFVGTFVDRYGHRCKVMILCGVIMMICHTYFAFATDADPSPIFALVPLGLAYAMLLTFWPCIPLVVHESKLSTAL